SRPFFPTRKGIGAMEAYPIDEACSHGDRPDSTAHLRYQVFLSFVIYPTRGRGLVACSPGILFARQEIRRRALSTAGTVFRLGTDRIRSSMFRKSVGYSSTVDCGSAFIPWIGS